MSQTQIPTDWRARLAAALEAKPMSKRAASLAAGLGAGAVHSWLSEGKDPSVDNLMEVCRVLGTSLTYVMYGYKITPEVEEVLGLLQDNPQALDGIRAILLARKAS